MSQIKYQCSRCKQTFPKKYNLDKHLKRKNPCQSVDLEVTVIDQIQSLNEADNELEEIMCDYCHMKLTNMKDVKKHYDSCAQPINQSSSQNFIEQINKLKTEFQQQINELKQKPKVVEQHNHNHSHNHNHNHNQILQVVCVGNNDNYLDMLTEELGFDRALGFIKDCALSHLSGDCKLLERIYFANRDAEAPIRYLDKNRKKIEFVDEMKQKIIDLKGIQLTRRLVNNLQNSYLKGVNYLINRNLDNNLCPNKFLEEYDIQSWNQHIYDLSEASYQKKIIAQLDIPCKSN